MQSKQHHWSDGEYFIKRSFDILFSLLAILILLPFYLLIVLLIYFSSGQPVFYLQERVGKDFTSFKMIKFRTMHLNAEESGPRLAATNDARITPLGKRLRRWRIDEIPQFFNVLLGHMSIVGPRPERRVFVQQLRKSVNDYQLLFQVKPGITSSGMVNYGYASTIEEMKERAQYDIAYLKRLSLIRDVQILLATVMVILRGKGK